MLAGFGYRSVYTVVYLLTRCVFRLVGGDAKEGETEVMEEKAKTADDS
jgi:hypothetical protein